MADDAPQDTSTSNPLPGVAGIVTIEAPPYTKGSEATAKPKLNLEAPSIRNIDQAWALCKSTEQANKLRSERATLMELQYTGQPPYSQGNQVQQAQSWQSNVCTGILQGIVDQKVLQFTQAITGLIYLTRSSLPTTWPDWKSKSDKFDIHTTRMIQGWGEYGTFVPNLAKENVLHGYGFSVFLDPRTWQPRFFKQETAYVPDEAPQHASKLQFFVIKHDYLLHEFIDLFRDEAAAAEMGYNIENCIEAAHNSRVKDPKEDATTTNFRKFAEFISDGVLGLTYAVSGPRVVKCYLMWNREYDGSASFWIVSRDDGKKLRMASKIYRRFEEVLTMFSFQPGNGHLHSSKGLGRMLIGLVIAAEKMRNKGFDDTFIGSMMILRASSKDRNKLQPVVQAPFIVLDSSIELGAQRFPVNAEAYAAMDERTNAYIEQAGGTYIQNKLGKDNKPQTATAERISATREEEAQDIIESRWINQFMGLVQTIQLRAYTDEHINEAKELLAKIAGGEQETEEFWDKVQGDRDAVQTLVNMMKDGLEDEEIKIMRRAPATGYAHTDDSITSRGILAVKQGYSNNPNIDQVELDKRSVEALAGPDAASALCIPTPDQTVLAEATRMQQSECVTMQTLGVPVSVSPRDNHLIHGEIVMQLLMQLGPQVADINVAPPTLKQAELNLNHLGDHLQEFLKRGGVTQNAQYKKLNDFYRTFKQQFTQAIQIHEQQKVASQFPHPEMASKIAGAVGRTPPPTDGSAAVPGAISEGAPMGDGVPNAGADLKFKSGVLSEPPQKPQSATSEKEAASGKT